MLQEKGDMGGGGAAHAPACVLLTCRAASDTSDVCEDADQAITVNAETTKPTMPRLAIKRTC